METASANQRAGGPERGQAARSLQPRAACGLTPARQALAALAEGGLKRGATLGEGAPAGEWWEFEAGGCRGPLEEGRDGGGTEAHGWAFGGLTSGAGRGAEFLHNCSSGSDAGFSASPLLTFGARGFFVVGAVLCLCFSHSQP